MSAARRIGFGLLGLVLGLICGGVVGLLLGLGFNMLANTPNFEGQSGFVVALFILIGVVIGAMVGSILGVRRKI